jgi:hypothetical protein
MTTPTDKETSMAFKTFHEAADDFFAHVDPKLDHRTVFYSGAITALLLMVQAKDNAGRDAIQAEIMEFIRKRQR